MVMAAILGAAVICGTRNFNILTRSLQMYSKDILFKIISGGPKIERYNCIRCTIIKEARDLKLNGSYPVHNDAS